MMLGQSHFQRKKPTQFIPSVFIEIMSKCIPDPYKRHEVPMVLAISGSVNSPSNLFIRAKSTNQSFCEAPGNPHILTAI